MKESKKMKTTITKAYDMDKNHQIILSKIERRESRKKRNWLSDTLIPICLLLMMTIMITIGDEKRSLTPVVKEKDQLIYINQLHQLAVTKLDADVKQVDFDQMDLSRYQFLNRILIPQDLIIRNTKAIYTRLPNATEYTELNHYVVEYTQEGTNRSITISFSDQYKPLRDYYIDSEKGKESHLNQTKFVLYQYEGMYMTFFEYQNSKFDIETNGLSESEVITLLQSILGY